MNNDGRTGAWMADAACVDHPRLFADPLLDWTVDEHEWLGPVETGTGRAMDTATAAEGRMNAIRAAGIVCGRCPVIDQCREWATRWCTSGFAAGFTGEEWATIRRRAGDADPGEDHIPVLLGLVDEDTLAARHVEPLLRAGLTCQQIAWHYRVGLRTVERVKRQIGATKPVPAVRLAHASASDRR